MTKYTPASNNKSKFTTEDLAVLESIGDERKAKIKVAYDARQEKFAKTLRSIAERNLNFAKRRQMENAKTYVKNRERREKIEFKLENIREIDTYRKLNLIKALKIKDQKNVTTLAKVANNRIKRKRENDLKRYEKLFHSQNLAIETNKTLLKECVGLKNKYTKLIVPVIPKEEKIEETKETIEPLVVMNSSVKTNYVSGEDVTKPSHLKFKDRIRVLKKSFSTCDVGIEFWQKTTPLWDRMMLCLEEEPLTVDLDKSLASIPDDYKNENVNLIDFNRSPKPTNKFKETDRSLVQRIMLNDINYHLSDQTIIEMMKEAESLSGLDAVAADIIDLTKCMVEYEADAQDVVKYMVDGLTERSVFEFAKKNIAIKLFGDARRVIDRLKHINDKGLIPQSVIKSRDKAKVSSILIELMTNESYGYFDMPYEDGSMETTTALEKIRQFQQHGHRSEMNASFKWHPMVERDKMLKVIFTAVNAFLGLAHEVTAVDMSANKSEKLVLHKIPKLTIRMVLRVARKLAKLVFRMIPSDEQKLCNLYKAAKVYSSIVSKRTPRFKYDTIKYREREEVEFDFKFFPERVDWLVRNGKNFAIDDCVDV